MNRTNTKRAPMTASSSKLHRFEGRDVIGTRVAITNAGDGLSQALAIEPIELSIGSKVYVVLECEVGQVGFQPVKDTEVLNRVQKLRAGTATIVDKGTVIGFLDAQRIKLEEAAGLHRLDFAVAATDDEDSLDDDNG